ncbi:MAG: hypothetical protein GWP17_07000 [Aquificales bacterium]|nr:hypothetical protein [Aquificales bacterium]
MPDNALQSQEVYERFLYTLPMHYPIIRRSTLVYIPSDPLFGRMEGFLLFDAQLVLCVSEQLSFLGQGEIAGYGYEVSRSQMTHDELVQFSAAAYCGAVYDYKEKLYWYDSFAHPNNPDLASTHPHHKHVHPDIKHNRIPAPDLSFTRPNLPFLLAEMEPLLVAL